jgi:hypothetical protein
MDGMKPNEYPEEDRDQAHTLFSEQLTCPQENTREGRVRSQQAGQRRLVDLRITFGQTLRENTSS